MLKYFLENYLIFNTSKHSQSILSVLPPSLLLERKKYAFVCTAHICMKNKLPHWQINPRTMLLAAVVLKAQWRTLFPYELSMLFSTSVINMPEQCITNLKAQARRPQKLLCLMWGNWKEAFTVLENMLADCASSEPSVFRKMFMYKKDKSCLILGSEATITVIF